MKKVLACLLGLLLVVGVTVSLSHYAWAKEQPKPAAAAGVKAPEKAAPAAAPGTAGTAGVKAPAKPAPATAPGTAGTAGEKAPGKTGLTTAPAKP